MMTDTQGAPAYTRFHWAKSDRQDSRRIHLLEHHLADVGACFEALLAQPTIRDRLAHSGVQDSLDDATGARLAVFAALHDIGKVNVGFQARIWSQEHLSGKRRLSRAGHTADIVPILNGDDYATFEWFSTALEWDDFLSWDDRDGETTCAMLVATLSHHGRPLKLEGGLSRNPDIWRPFGDLSPEECVRRIGKYVREWFPSAFAPGARPLPSAPAFQHMFLGLCNWADWIGSNERWFPYVDMPRDDYIETARKQAKTAVDAIGLDLSAQRDDLELLPEFGELFNMSGSPNSIQKKVRDTPLAEQLVIVESETGSGKTEAALWRFADMYKAGLVDGLYFALPTRSAAVQMHGRVERFIAKMLPAQHRPPVVLAVPGYAPGADAGGVAMPNYDSSRAGHDDTDRPWATENPKRFLAAQIAVGTVDQAMMGALQVKNAHMRAACLARNLLVVDEVHASDTYMSVVLEALLDAHVGAGGYALLMSATLGSTARHRWLHHGERTARKIPPLEEATGEPYPAVSVPACGGDSIVAAGENDQKKTVAIEAVPRMHDFADTARRALGAARAGAKVLVVRNTVDHAVSTQRALESMAEPGDAELLFAIEGVTTLHHGRFASCDRTMLDKQVERLLGKGRRSGGRVVVGTQTLEQSLDIDADLLITDLCPVDVLLQRIGRLHRHKDNNQERAPNYNKPSCIVLTPPNDDLAPLLTSGQAANGLGPRGGVYEDLRTLEATRRLIAEHPEWEIPCMNRLLVERATHPDALQSLADELGEDWQTHAVQIEGGEIGDGLTARGVTIKRGKSFLTDNPEVLFVSSDERIRTRLGDDRIDIAFDAPQRSPLDGSSRIERLAVSVRWLPDGDVPDSVTPSQIDGGFEFALGDRIFRYDRLGLRRA